VSDIKLEKKQIKRPSYSTEKNEIADNLFELPI